MHFRKTNHTSTYSVSGDTFKILSTYMPYVGIHTLEKIKEMFDLPYSISTMYTAFSQMHIPSKPMRLCYYLCNGCEEQLNILHPFFGFPNWLLCPQCESTLIRTEVLSLPFYYPVDVEYYFNGQHILPVNTSEFINTVGPSLTVWEKSFPLFKKDQHSNYHIIREFDQRDSIFYCDIRLNTSKSSRTVSGASRIIACRDVCHHCMMEVILQWNRGKSIMPQTLDNKPSKRDFALKLFIDIKHLGAINPACLINKISRRTFYRMKNKYVTEFYEILGDHLS